MALFPSLGPEYYNEEHRDILKRMEDFYNNSITINQTFWMQADIDARFEAGDQSVFDEIYEQDSIINNKKISFNRIRRIKNMISGYQRRNRKSIIATPVENADNDTADQFSKIMTCIIQRENVLETISEAYDGALVTGLSLLQIWNDFRYDPISGDIKVDYCPYNSFLIDPYFRKADLSDCNGLWKRTYVSKMECLSLLPDRKDEIESFMNQDSKDGKFQFLPESNFLDTTNLLTYDEFYYRSYRTQKILIDAKTGETLEWTEQDKESLEIFLATYPSVSVVSQEIPTVRLAIVVQGHVMYDGLNPLGIDEYPFVPVFGYYNPQLSNYSDRLQGVVRGLRDSQFLYNRYKVMELNIIESHPNSGWIVKENALVNPRDVFKTGQGQILVLKKGAQMTDIMPIQTQDVPPSLIQLSELMGREPQEISGANEELLGSAVDDKAGVLAMLRQGAGLTTLQNLFDQLDRSQKILGRLLLKVIQSNFTPGKVKRIVEEEPTPQFYNKAFGKYDAVVEEGINTTTQKQMQFIQLMKLRELGVPIPDDVLLESVTIQNKKKLIESIQKINEQTQQMQQIQAQSAMQEQLARTDLSHSVAMANKGLGLERVSRIEENQSQAEERKAAAVKDNEIALVNLVKAIKEIQEIDLNQFQKIIQLNQILQQERNQENANTEQQSILQTTAMNEVLKPMQQPQQQPQQPQQQDMSALMNNLGS